MDQPIKGGFLNLGDVNDTISVKDFVNLLLDEFNQSTSDWYKYDGAAFYNTGQLLIASVSPLFVYPSCIIFGVSGVIGNLLLLAITFHPELQNVSYRIHLSFLSVSDTLGMVLSITDMLLQLRETTLGLMSPNLHVCRLVFFFSEWFLTFSPWLLVCFSVDRYIAVVFPLKKKFLCTVRNSWIACFLTVALTALLRVPSLLYLSMVNLNGKYTCITTMTAVSEILWPIIVIVGTMLPSVCIFYFNGHTLVAIIRSLRQRMTIASAEERQTRESTRRATIALVSLPVYALLATTPFVVLQVYVVLQFRIKSIRSMLVTESALNLIPNFRILYLTSFAANLYLLLGTSKKYRKITLETIKRLVWKNNPERANTSTNASA